MALVRVPGQLAVERAPVLVQGLAALAQPIRAAAPACAAEHPAARQVACKAEPQANHAVEARDVVPQQASGVALPSEMAPNAVRRENVPVRRSAALAKTDPAAPAVARTDAVRPVVTTIVVVRIRETVGRSAANAARRVARSTAWTTASGRSFASRLPAQA